MPCRCVHLPCNGTADRALPQVLLMPAACSNLCNKMYLFKCNHSGPHTQLFVTVSDCPVCSPAGPSFHSLAVFSNLQYPYMPDTVPKIKYFQTFADIDFRFDVLQLHLFHNILLHLQLPRNNKKDVNPSLVTFPVLIVNY